MSAFRSMVKTLVNGAVNRAHLMSVLQCEMKISTALPQVTENVKAGRDQTVFARTIHQQLHKEEYYSRVEVYKPFITKMNEHR